MNEYINYLIEANAGLCFFAMLYWLLLRHETDFRIKRILLLIGITASVTFPLIHIDNTVTAIPSLQEVIPTVWLPEFFVAGSEVGKSSISYHLSGWNLIVTTYGIGVILFLSLFLFQLIKLAYLINTSKTKNINALSIIESNENKPSFSFFSFIYIGQSNTLSIKEKEQIIAHESIHATQLHSFDILLLNIAGIFFWFNPLIRIYKTIFIQLHEFEADARAVKTNEVNEYCSLLAKVALLSADIRIANYFNNSLTLKRIEMIRKIKMKLNRWKIITVASMVLIFFFVVACHDQVLPEINEAVKSSSMALEVPAHVQKRYDQLSKENPTKKYVLIQLNEEGTESLTVMEEKYGLPKSMEVYTPNVKTGKGSISVEASNGVIMKKELPYSNSDEGFNFVILEYDEAAKNIANSSQQDGVFTVVEESASPQGGMPALYEFLSKNILYPKQSRQAGIEGKVLVEFIVETDGTVSALNILKGVDPAIDAEALRVMELSPKWNPGKNNGVDIRQRLVLPINFSLGNNKEKKTSSIGATFPYPLFNGPKC